MRTIRFVAAAIAFVAIGCGENTKGATPKVDTEAAAKGNGEAAKKAVDEAAKANPAIKASGPNNKRGAID